MAEALNDPTIDVLDPFITHRIWHTAHSKTTRDSDHPVDSGGYLVGEWYHYSYHFGGSMAVTASEARKNLFPLIEQVNDDRTPIEITSRRGDAVLLSRADYDALEETAHLLRVPANAKRLIESLQQALAGQREEHDLLR